MERKRKTHFNEADMLSMSSPSTKKIKKELSNIGKKSLDQRLGHVTTINTKYLGKKYGIGKSSVSDVLNKKGFYKEQFKN